MKCNRLGIQVEWAVPIAHYEEKLKVAKRIVGKVKNKDVI